MQQSAEAAACGRGSRTTAARQPAIARRPMAAADRAGARARARQAGRQTGDRANAAATRESQQAGGSARARAGTARADRRAWRGSSSSSAQQAIRSGQRLVSRRRRPRRHRQAAAGSGGGRPATTLAQSARGHTRADAAKSRELLDQLRARRTPVPRGGPGFTFEGQGMMLSAPGTEASSRTSRSGRSCASRRRALDARRNVAVAEAAGRRRRRIGSPPASTTSAPAAYQQQVDSYFKALAGEEEIDLGRCISRLRSRGGSASLVAAAIAALAFCSYRRPLVPLSPDAARHADRAARAGARAIVVLFLCRPIVLLPPAGAGDVVVPVLVDVSRSMRVADADGAAADRARRGDPVAATRCRRSRAGSRPRSTASASRRRPRRPDELTADARHSDLTGALASDPRALPRPARAGIVVLSDGGDTGQCRRMRPRAGPPVFAIGVGSPDGVQDREVLGVTAGDPRLDQASVDLHVSAVSRGYGRDAVRAAAARERPAAREPARHAGRRRLADRRDVHRLARSAERDGLHRGDRRRAERRRSPRTTRRSVLVSPAGRKRRILLLDGRARLRAQLPGARADAGPGLELDSVVRKGKNESGQARSSSRRRRSRPHADLRVSRRRAKRCSATTRSSSPTSKATSSRARS